MRRRWWLVVIAGLGILLSWLLGAVVVRVGLDWSDTFPYSAASEWRYLAVAIVALSLAIGGTALAVILTVRAAQRCV